MIVFHILIWVAYFSLFFFIIDEPVYSKKQKIFVKLSMAFVFAITSPLLAYWTYNTYDEPLYVSRSKFNNDNNLIDWNNVFRSDTSKKVLIILFDVSGSFNSPESLNLLALSKNEVYQSLIPQLSDPDKIIILSTQKVSEESYVLSKVEKRDFHTGILFDINYSGDFQDEEYASSSDVGPSLLEVSNIISDYKNHDISVFVYSDLESRQSIDSLDLSNISIYFRYVNDIKSAETIYNNVISDSLQLYFKDDLIKD